MLLPFKCSFEALTFSFLKSQLQIVQRLSAQFFIFFLSVHLKVMAEAGGEEQSMSTMCISLRMVVVCFCCPDAIGFC